MAKCAKCKKKKAKRLCRVLGDELCSLCCGLLRNREIHCPADCNFLVQHRPYQEKKIIKKKPSSPSRPELRQKDILNDERMVWLALHIESPLNDFGERNPSFADKDAILALEYAKEKIEKNSQVIILPDADLKPKNEAGEAILRSVAECRYQRNVILADGSDTYKNEEKLQCLERVILLAKSRVGENFEGRTYLRHLFKQFAQIQEHAHQTKIISPH